MLRGMSWLVLIVGLVGCSQDDAQSLAMDQPISQTSLTSDVSQQDAVLPRLVIKDASLQLIVVDPVESVERVANLANESGGWVVSSNTSHYTASGDEGYRRAVILDPCSHRKV